MSERFLVKGTGRRGSTQAHRGQATRLKKGEAMMIADGHLDLAYNALRGRDVLVEAARQAADEEGIPTVGLPDLRRGEIGLICATIFCEPAGEGKGGYATVEQAMAAGRAQLDWYLRQRDAGVFRFVRTPAEVPGQAAGDLPMPMVLLLEGADPIGDAGEVPWWFSRGLRAVGLAWKRTRYAGGTRAPGSLTPEGVELARALDAAGIVHDLSHLAEESFWQLLDLCGGAVMASHSNCRAIVPTDRQLSDAMIRAVAGRKGVVGINFYDKFLLSPDEHGKRRATIADVARHARHICELAGNGTCVGLGTDMDGGLGREQIPEEIMTSGDLPKVGDGLSEAGFSDEDVRGILGGNWAAFWRRSLPERV
jgi:membrane dipeptidase